MRILSISLIIASLLIAIPSHAFQVNVMSTNKNVEGLGFTVNGKKNGGMGSTYHKSGMSKGNYSFGVRLHGKDIGCKDENGKTKITLTHNTSVVLNLKGKRCTAIIRSK